MSLVDALSHGVEQLRETASEATKQAIASGDFNLPGLSRAMRLTQGNGDISMRFPMFRNKILTMFCAVFGGGFGFTDDDTLWCLHAAYYYRLGNYVSSALFGTLGIAYTGLSADNFTQSFIDFQFKLLMFTALTKSKEVFLIYGALLAYGLGNTEFNDSFKNKYSQITAGIVMGLYILARTLPSVWPF